MKGGGTIWLQLTGYPGALTRNAPTSCADLGASSDALPFLEGRYTRS